MPADSERVVMVQGADGEPMRMNQVDFDRDQSDEGEKQFSLHADHEKYDENGELLPQHRNEAKQERRNGETGQDGNDVSGHGAELTDEEKARAKRIASTNFGVMQEGKKFYVVDMNAEGKRIEDLRGINPKGYKSNKEAWDAVMIVRTEAAEQNPMPATNPANQDANNEDGDNENE